MSRLALIGYGRMGKLVEQLAPGHGFEVVLHLNGSDHRIDERFQGVDVAIDAAGKPAANEAVVASVRPGGAIGVPSVHPGPITFDVQNRPQPARATSPRGRSGRRGGTRSRRRGARGRRA